MCSPNEGNIQNTFFLSGAVHCTISNTLEDVDKLRNIMGETMDNKPPLNVFCGGENMKDSNPHHMLTKIRGQNVDNIIIAHLNINSLPNKFEVLKSLVLGNVDLLIISETKIDESFPLNQFIIEGFSSPFREDRNSQGGGLIIYVREDIPSKRLTAHKLPHNVEGIFIELIINKSKWFLIGGYNPHKENISYFLRNISKMVDANIRKYENFLLIGDFNADINDHAMSEFCEMYNLKNLINEPTFYKNPDNPSSIDVILTNRKRSFESSTAIETGLSDHHKMIITVLKSNYKKRDPLLVNYRSYKKFDENLFRNELANTLENLIGENMGYDEFKNVFMKTLNLHAPMKKKTVRGNNAQFMNHTLSQAFMHRSKLKNIFNKDPTDGNKKLYNQQRNYCVSLLRKEKKKYYNNLDIKIFDDNRKFWKRVRPLFTDKQKPLEENITLVENEVITTVNKEVAEKLNSFFTAAVENLNIESFLTENTNVLAENLQGIVDQYANHPSIIKINENVREGTNFSFKDMSPQDFESETLKLDSRKANSQDDIPTRMLIITYDIVSNHLSEHYNKAKNYQQYPASLKLADVTPIHKKDEKTLTKNYRPISLIPVVSKIFEKNMYKEIMDFIGNSLSPYLFGFRKGHSTEQCLVVMLEAWKKALDEKGTAGAILTDLSKAFDCLNHDLLLAKLSAYDFSMDALKFIRSYLKDRKQRTKVGTDYSAWLNIKYGVPQGSVLDPLLFNIFLNDIFFFIRDISIANYADDNTTYTTDINVENLLSTLERETSILLEWFKFNEMKLNEDKCHLLVANQTEDKSIRLGNETVVSSRSVELLGVKIDEHLKFTEHITKLCKKGNQKLHALARISKYLNKDKLKILMKTFIISQFNYCPLTWMFHNRTLNNKINRLHERALRLVYDDENLSFEELLELDNSMTIHHRNLQKLAIEMYKIKNNLCPIPMKEIFSDCVNTYDLRNKRYRRTLVL